MVIAIFFPKIIFLVSSFPGFLIIFFGYFISCIHFFLDPLYIFSLRSLRLGGKFLKTHQYRQCENARWPAYPLR